MLNENQKKQANLGLRAETNSACVKARRSEGFEEPAVTQNNFQYYPCTKLKTSFCIYFIQLFRLFWPLLSQKIAGWEEGGPSPYWFA